MVTEEAGRDIAQGWVHLRPCLGLILSTIGRLKHWDTAGSAQNKGNLQVLWENNPDTFLNTCAACMNWSPKACCVGHRMISQPSVFIGVHKFSAYLNQTAKAASCTSWLVRMLAHASGSPPSLYFPESLQGWAPATSDPIFHPVALPREPQLAGAFNQK